jgi:hypothetical protein
VVRYASRDFTIPHNSLSNNILFATAPLPLLWRKILGVLCAIFALPWRQSAQEAGHIRQRAGRNRHAGPHHTANVHRLPGRTEFVETSN